MRTKIIYDLNEAKLVKILELMEQEVLEVIHDLKAVEEIKASLERGDLVIAITEDNFTPWPTIPGDRFSQGVVIGMAFDRAVEEAGEVPDVMRASAFIDTLLAMHMADMIKYRYTLGEKEGWLLN